MGFPANTGWLTVFFSRGSSSRKDRTLVSCVGSWIYYHWATWEALGEINIFQMETYVFSFWRKFLVFYLGKHSFVFYSWSSYGTNTEFLKFIYVSLLPYFYILEFVIFLENVPNLIFRSLYWIFFPAFMLFELKAFYLTLWILFPCVLMFIACNIFFYFTQHSNYVYLQLSPGQRSLHFQWFLSCICLLFWWLYSMLWVFI